MQGAGAVKNGIKAARAPQTDGALAPAAPVFRRMSDIQSRPICWLWPGRIARGKVTLIAGHPGLGKSQIMASLAAIVSIGGQWPADHTSCEIGNAVILSAEDDAEDTIKPRLEAAGADMDRVYVLDAIKEVTDAGEVVTRAFNLKTDLARLDEMLIAIGGAALVVIDPISAYLGTTDSHVNAEVRSLLSPLGELAARHGAAIVAVSHLNKSSGNAEALLRVTGSLAFVAAARAAFIVARDQDDPERRLFLPIKNNISKDQTGYAFTVRGHALPGGIDISRVEWEAESVTITADEAMTPVIHSDDRSELEDAKAFLRGLLADGSVPSKQVEADAESAGHSWATIRRAQQSLGVEAIKDGMKSPWLWRLPTKMLKTHEDAQEKT